MTIRAAQRRSSSSTLLRAFDGLDAWFLVSAGVEAQRVVSVRRTKWTVCYKIHVIPSRRIEYRASITLWPMTRTTLASRRQPGWRPELLKSNWYQVCGRELRRHGYHGSWLWSPCGRFGDFWKTLRDFSSLAREVRLLEHLRREPFFGAGPSNTALQRTGARGARPGR
jgi:hypothetical protein